MNRENTPSETTATAVARSNRITRANVEARVDNVNRRMESRGSIYRYTVEGRNGYTALDRIRVTDGKTVSTVTVGSKRDLADYLHAMMVALDDATQVAS